MYIHGNPKTKKELKEWISSGRSVQVFSPGLGTPTRNGVETVEGPHSPEPHRWYAQVVVKEGLVVRVLP